MSGKHAMQFHLTKLHRRPNIRYHSKLRARCTTSTYKDVVDQVDQFSEVDTHATLRCDLASLGLGSLRMKNWNVLRRAVGCPNVWRFLRFSHFSDNALFSFLLLSQFFDILKLLYLSICPKFCRNDVKSVNFHLKNFLSFNHLNSFQPCSPATFCCAYSINSISIPYHDLTCYLVRFQRYVHIFCHCDLIFVNLWFLKAFTSYF